MTWHPTTGEGQKLIKKAENSQKAKDKRDAQANFKAVAKNVNVVFILRFADGTTRTMAPINLQKQLPCAQSIWQAV